MMKVVVFGGCGFLGRGIVNALLESDSSLDVTIVDRSAPLMEDPVSRVHYIRENFSEKSNFAECVADADLVVHLISTSIPGNERGIRQEIINNVLPSVRLFESCVVAGVHKILFLSSGGTVYGNVDKPSREADPLNPVNTYGLQKMMIEHSLRMICQGSGVSYQIIRMSNPYGPGQNPQGQLGLITKLVYQILHGQTIRIFGDGSVVRDFLYISDAIRGVMDILNKGEANAIYNLGSGEGASVGHVLDLIRTVIPEEATVRYEQSRSVDVPYSVLDIGRYLMIRPHPSFIPLEEGIRHTYDYLRKDKR